MNDVDITADGGNGMRHGKILLLTLIGCALVSGTARGDAFNEGKEFSVVIADVSIPTLPPCTSGFTGAASIPLPTKYKSKKHSLLITTSFQGYCPSDIVQAAVTIAGRHAYPGIHVLQCNGQFSTTTTSLWFLYPDSPSQEPIPPGSTAEFGLCRTGSSGVATSAHMRVEIAQ
jgi:hypothetical protein